MRPTIKALVVDLGDVLFSWQPPKDGKVSPKELKRAMSTSPWYDFERGRLSEQECYLQIGGLMSIPSDDLADTINQAKLSLRPDSELLSILNSVKGASRRRIKIYLMSNISQPHWEYVLSIQREWDLFDQIFTSAEAHMRKPDLCFYKHVRDSIGLRDSPSSALFIDEKLENVCSAQAVGMQGLVFDTADNVVRRVRNMLSDPIERGMEYLKANAKQFRTTCNTPTSHNIDMKEDFAQLLILEATSDKTLVAFKDYHLLWNFFQDHSVLITTEFPDDYDTTSLALTILDGYHPPHVIKQILDKSLTNQSPDHLPLVYEDPSRPRFDPVACVHIYTLFQLNHRSHELLQTWDYICGFLDSRAYEQGTYYYATPEYFLYALARLVSYSRKCNVPLPTISKCQSSNSSSNNFLDLLETRCRSHINTGPANAISLALRIIASRTAGVPAADLEADAQRLMTLQEDDAGWPWCEIYRAPFAKAGIGSKGVVTSFAIKALRMMDGDVIYEDTAGKEWVSGWRLRNVLSIQWLRDWRMTFSDTISRALGTFSDAALARLGGEAHSDLRSWVFRVVSGMARVHG